MEIKLVNKSKGKAVCILGMHRGGTSSLAGTLNILGLYLGENSKLLDTSKHNIKGYWENIDIVSINEEIFNILNTTWHDLTPLPDNWHKSPSLSIIKEKIQLLLNNQFLNNSFWGWKDPRTCLLLPIWKEIISNNRIDLNYIIIIRNPLEVASSLEIRNNFILEKSVLLWQHYVSSSLKHCNSQNVAIINYEDLVNNCEETLESISDVLNFEFIKEKLGSNKEIINFLDKKLIHNKFSYDDLINSSEVPEIVKNTYDLCQELINNKFNLKNGTNEELINNIYIRYQNSFKNILKESETIPISTMVKKYEEKIITQANIIKDINKTLSWKITSPLRKLKDLIKFK